MSWKDGQHFSVAPRGCLKVNKIRYVREEAEPLRCQASVDEDPALIFVLLGL